MPSCLSRTDERWLTVKGHSHSFELAELSCSCKQTANLGSESARRRWYITRRAGAWVPDGPQECIGVHTSG